MAVMTEQEKNELVQKALEEAAKIFYVTLMLCEAKTHINGTVDIGGDLYSLTFTKLTKTEV